MFAEQGGEIFGGTSWPSRILHLECREFAFGDSADVVVA